MLKSVRNVDKFSAKFFDLTKIVRFDSKSLCNSQQLYPKVTSYQIYKKNGLSKVEARKLIWLKDIKSNYNQLSIGSNS